MTQRCPRCGGDRIRSGYRETPWWWAVLGRYNLLCDSCNWEFVGFAVPGTVSARFRKRRKQNKRKLAVQEQVAESEPASVAETPDLSQTIALHKASQPTDLATVDDSSIDNDLVSGSGESP